MTNPWLRALAALPLLCAVALFGWGIYRQIVLGQPWGRRPMSNGMLLAVAAFTLLIGGALAGLAIVVEMRTRVYRDRTEIRYRPFKTRTTMAAEIVSAAAVTYQPMRDFGGWGIKHSSKKRAWIYSISGDQAVDLTLVGDAHLFIGTRRPTELESAIRSISH